MVEVKYRQDHPAGATPEARIAHRLRNSGDTAHADVSVVHGEGPTRTHTNIHHTRNTDYGKGNPGEGDVDGHKRGVV
jgi:hypothetical protein